MPFDRAEYQRIADSLVAGADDLHGLLARVPGAVGAGLAAIDAPAPVRHAIAWCADELVSLTAGALDTIVELLRGAVAPILFFDTAYRWETVRGTATGVAGTLDPAHLPATGAWSGEAAAAYARVVKPQGDAAARVGAVADKVALTLVAGATAGLTFYVAVGIILAKLIAAIVAALAAFGTAALSAAGIAIILEEAAVTPALLTAAVSALVAVLGTQAAQLVILHGEAADTAAFPGGSWPAATADRYADATVTDGDADWSLAR
jgi:hypothetical protein